VSVIPDSFVHPPNFLDTKKCGGRVFPRESPPLRNGKGEITGAKMPPRHADTPPGGENNSRPAVPEI
jgi:hypothetical protein